MPDSAEPATLEGLERAYERGRATERRYRLVARALSGTLLVVILLFLGAIWGRAREAYALEKFEGPAREEAERLTRSVRERAREVVKEAAPVYTRLAQETLEEALPLLKTSLVDEWQALSTSLQDRARPAVAEMLERLEARQRERLGRHFPTLRDPAGEAMFRDRWKAAIVQDHVELLEEIDRRYGGHVVALGETLEGFRPNRFESFEEERLTRHFVHLWLMLLDREILQIDGTGQVNATGEEGRHGGR